MTVKDPKNCILVAEDDDLTSELIVASLRQPGRELLLATDGEMALQMARRHHPQLIVLDLVMPVRGGLEVLRTLRKDPAANGTRILVLSAQEQKATEEEVRRCGADDFLAKPFDPEELAGRASRLLPQEVPVDDR